MLLRDGNDKKLLKCISPAIFFCDFLYDANNILLIDINEFWHDSCQKIHATVSEAINLHIKFQICAINLLRKCKNALKILKTYRNRVSDQNKVTKNMLELGRGEICPCRHCRVPSVNFLSGV